MDENLKSTIYSILTEIPDLRIFQERPDVISDDVLPCVTFRVSNDVPTYTLDNDIGKKNIDVVIDIWGNDDDETSSIKVLVEAKMREFKYLLTFNSDIVEPSGGSHLTTVFTY